MQNDKIYSDIVTVLVRSKLEANILLSEIDELEKALFKIGEGDWDAVLEKAVRAKTALAIRQAIGETDRKTFLTKLRDQVNSLTYIGLTLAFEPTSEIVSRLSTWIKQNVGEAVALDIAIDKRILGGAIIDYKGKRGNFTLLTKVNAYFV